MVNAKEIRRRREELKLSFGEAAERAGFKHRGQWQIVESGTRKGASADTVMTIARVLRCKMEDLMIEEPRKLARATASRRRVTK